MSDRITVQVSHGTTPMKTLALTGKLPEDKWDKFRAELEALLKKAYPEITITSRS